MTTPRWKRSAYRILIVLFVISLIGSTVAVWANVRLQESEAWAAMVGPLADDPAIQEYIVGEASAMIDHQIGLDADGGRLRDISQSQLSSLIRVILNDFVTSPTFSRWWTDANLVAHAGLMALVNSDDQSLVQTRGDEIILDLQPVVDWTNSQLMTLLPNLGYRIQIPEGSAQVTLFQSAALEQLTSLLHRIDTLAWVLPLVTLVLLAAILIIVPRRGHAALHLGWALAAGMVGLLLTLTFARTWIVGQQEPKLQDVIDAGFRIILVDLTGAFRFLALIGLGMVAIWTLAHNARVVQFLRDHRQIIAGIAAGAAVVSLIAIDYPPMWLAILALGVFTSSLILLFLWRDEPPMTAAGD